MTIKRKPVDAVIERLATRPLAFTTLGGRDSLFAHHLQTALIRGEDELFPWGIGGAVERGSIVALYVPGNSTMREEERVRVRHLYVAAADARDMSTFEGKDGMPFPFRSMVLLYRRLTLATPLDRSDMMGRRSSLGRHARANFRLAGHQLLPGSQDLEFRRDFWELLLALNPEMAGRIAERLVRGHDDDDDIALSYASEDLPTAQPIYEKLLWAQRPLADRQPPPLKIFYSTTAWDTQNVSGAHESLLVALRQVFTTTRLCIPLLSQNYLRKPWPLLELGAMCEHPDRLLPVTIDGSTLADVDVDAVDFRAIVPDSQVTDLKRHLARTISEAGALTANFVVVDLRRCEPGAVADVVQSRVN